MAATKASEATPSCDGYCAGMTAEADQPSGRITNF